ncbi:Lysosome-associated membrane glycoprotein 1 [Trachymyrmex zeteki]|uniref:Lysosome-associated membrane glycoprotein 5 n=1 Tax=Mycetomoellerius zeteki TaxID=64791 RepID=A0A151X9R5_9HYME|nr:PREDICTED: lysosome-associated membrane glycoprotein 1 [Trachymyrmex zeteki]KYQ57111.1 Lysosome-associated membrane glycoprotein 1 [Trachymyrmex zeteki]
MLKPLLLLCWAATIVSAGDPENVNTNDTSISINPTSYNADANPQSMLQPESNKQIEMHLVPPKDEHTLNNSTSTTTLTTTTTSSTTTSSTTTTLPTTTKSTTTSTPVPTTTAVPTTPTPITPLPPPSTKKWIVKENNTLCIIIQMAVQFNVSYTTDNITSYKVMDIPSNGTITGKCGKTEQNLTLSWESSQNKIIQDNFTIHFVKNETEKYYSLHHFEISLAAEEFPNDKSNKTVTAVHVTPQFKTGLSNSYRCIKEQQLDLTLKGSNVTVGLLKVTNLQFQAFRGDNTTIFGLAKDCSFDTPDIVPITVGCALAGLVVIVLIAYLVGRRRSQARGYLSM